MINIERTIEVFGYDPNSLKPQSHKLVIHNCEDCGIERLLKKQTAVKTKYCKKCNNKGERNHFYGCLFYGVKNGNYKDGKTLKNYYCRKCKAQVSIYSALYGDGNCQSCALKGTIHTEETKRKISKANKGKRSSNYIDGRTPLTVSIRNLLEYKKWRKSVFRRDNYICQECFVRGGRLEAHHKKEFRFLFAEFLKEYNQFSPIEDKETLVRLAMKWEPFWDINNGKTLCRDCHKLTYTHIKDMK